jgi:hypothetical protein
MNLNFPVFGTVVRIFRASNDVGLLFLGPGSTKLLKNLNPTKASGPDNISTRILKETATEVVPCFAIIFQHSYNTGQVPLLVFSYLVFLIYLLWWSVVEFHMSGLI